jgi:hypothetical protein
MHTCHHCGGRLHRVRRTLWQRLLYRSLYECYSCSAWERNHHTIFHSFTGVSRCPRCDSRRLKVFKKRDHIEGFQRNIYRRIQGWMGAKLCYCERCRLQFYDRRPIEEQRPRATAEPAAKPESVSGPDDSGNTVANVG